jgi:methionine-rich copper-binding protein CopC
VLKSKDLPPAPVLPAKIKISFSEKIRDQFFELALEAQKRKLWTVPI